MKHIFLKAICLSLFFIFSLGFLGALELEIIGGVNLLTFDPDKDMAYSDPLSPTTAFKPFPFTFGIVELRDELSESMSYNIRLLRDNILHNNLEATLSSRTDYIAFEFGVFAGLMDKIEMPTMGILVAVEFAYPGVVFLSLSASSTFGTQYDFTSEHFRETGCIKAGFWLPSIITTFTASFKDFTQQVDASNSIHNSLIRYMVSFDYFMKNFPVVFRLDAGYQTLARKYDDSIDAYTDTMNFYFAGLDVSWQINNQLRIIAGAEVPVYIKPVAPITTPVFYQMTKAFLGMVYTFQ